jgi:tripartite-type tricarboxylate transporter receptor subunit TctC
MNAWFGSTSIAVSIAAAIGCASIGSASAQAWPTRPVRLIVGFTAGGGSDLAARRLAERMTPRLGQPMIVENRVGAGGAIAGQAVAQAEPDGYMIYMPGASATAFHIFNKDTPLDLLKDFASVGKFVETVSMFVTNASQPYRTLAEFFAYAKANPGKLVYGTPGGPTRLALEMLRHQGGIEMLHVQYKGSVDYAQALLADQVHIIIDNPATQRGNFEAGKVRFLAVTNNTRSTVFPNIPTASESGLPGYHFASWNGLLFPAKTPRAVVDRVARELREIATSEDYKQETLKWSNGGYQASYETPEQFSALMAREMKYWTEAARIAKVEN